MGMRELFMWMPFALAFLLSMGKESCSSFLPFDNYLISCGSSLDIPFQGRTFYPDSVYEKDTDALEFKSQKSVVVTSSSGAPSPIYQSARISWGDASYIFRIGEPGHHWIRLYFSPLPDFHHNMSSASITVVTDDGLVLLKDFTFMEYGGSYLFKEYAIKITSSTFSLIFIPSPNSFVFVNAIEVVSMPEYLFVDAMNTTSVYSEHLSELALETAYRLDMGNESLTTRSDSLGRNWEGDEKYMASNSKALSISVDPLSINDNSYFELSDVKAPDWVYASAKAMADAKRPNLSWVFSINPNYRYFVRVHFCDIIGNSKDITVFDLFINGVAYERVSLDHSTSLYFVPYYKDFVVSTRADTMTVSVAPDRTANSRNATMNGLEIMKILNEVRSLDSISPSSSSRSVKLLIIVGSILGVAAFLVLTTITLLSYTKAYSSKACSYSSKTSSYSSKARSTATTRLCRLFTFQEISEATNNFDECLVLGQGGFGKVYEGTMDDGIKVAIKVANPESRQGIDEFQNEIELLSKLSHQNLVSLIGYCNEDSQKILVYQFLANGPLSSHLYGTNFIPLSWKQRLEICIGSAKGLHYLHTGAVQSIIHRDVKTANILLNEDFVPKLADFGISKKGPPLDKSHVTTFVKGSFGYLDPEYFRTKFLTEKSDVFSFGMVLMEVICGKPALDSTRSTEHINLAGWASSYQETGTFDQIVDPHLIGKVNLDSLNKVCKLAWKCLEESRMNRPPMGYVLCELQDALHLELASPSWQVSVDSAIDVDAENGITFSQLPVYRMYNH